MKSLFVTISLAAMVIVGPLRTVSQDKPGVVGPQNPLRGDETSSAARARGARSATITSAVHVTGVVEVQQGLFRVTDSRPLSRVAELLEYKLGVPISYEDAAWASPADIISAADLLGNRAAVAQNPGWKAPTVPKEATVDVVLPSTDSALRAAQPAALVQTAPRQPPDTPESGGV